jgi:hypothetical protein
MEPIEKALKPVTERCDGRIQETPPILKTVLFLRRHL